MGKRYWLLLMVVVLLTLFISTVYAVRFSSVEIKDKNYYDFYLKIVPTIPVIEIEPGGTTKFTMMVRKSSDPESLHDVEVRILNEEFDVDIEPKIIDELRNVDMKIVRVTMTAPADVDTGEYPLELEVAGKEFVTETFPINTMIEVGPINKSIDVVIGIAVIALLAILILRRVTAK